MATKPNPLTAAGRDSIALSIRNFLDQARLVVPAANGVYRIETTLDGQDWVGTAHGLTIQFKTPTGQANDLRCAIGLDVWNRQILCQVDLPAGDQYVPGLRNAGGTQGAFSPIANEEDVQFVVTEFLKAFPGIKVRDQRPVHT